MKYFVLFVALIFSVPVLAQDDTPLNDKPFGLWLGEFKKQAQDEGISQETLDNAFTETEPLDRVIELDRKQPESTVTLDDYLDRIVTKKRVAEGRKAMADNRILLRKIGQKYGVQPRFIVALWGLETNFGKNTGGFKVVDALATLAYDGRRSDFFRGELIDALRILDQEHMPAEDLKGSWAGALGQCQFMPDVYLKYAVDYDHDGKRDIWNTKGDVFASIANYLHAMKWDANGTWGRKVKAPAHFDPGMADIKHYRTLAQWRKIGVRSADGKTLPAKKINAALILVGDGDDAAPYLIYPDYKVLLQWNRSRYFATAVGALADAIDKPK